MENPNERFKNLETLNNIEKQTGKPVLQDEDSVTLEYPLGDIFKVAESHEIKDPTNEQWEAFQKDVLARISSAPKPKFLSSEWIICFRDKLSATDSASMKFFLFFILAMFVILFLAFVYFLVAFFSKDAVTLTGAAALEIKSCLSFISAII